MSTHPQAAEVARLLAHLIAKGFTLSAVSDGEDTTNSPTPEQAAAVICGVDEASLYVTHPDARTKDGARLSSLWLFIVLGNGPGELVNDHADREPLTSCLDRWSAAEETAAEHIAAGTVPTIPPADVIDTLRAELPAELSRHLFVLNLAATRAQSHAAEAIARAHLAAILAKPAA